MLLLLLVKAEKLGWELVASADVSAKFNQGPAILGPFRYSTVLNNRLAVLIVLQGIYQCKNRLP